MLKFIIKISQSGCSFTTEGSPRLHKNDYFDFLCMQSIILHHAINMCSVNLFSLTKEKKYIIYDCICLNFILDSRDKSGYIIKI